MPDGTSGRPASDTKQLLKLMSMRSEIVELGLAAAPESSRPAIEELPAAAPSVLDQLVQARVRIEEEALGTIEPPGNTGPVSEIDESADQLELQDWEADEEAALLADQEPVVDLLELNAAEAGQPVEIEPLDPPTLEAARVAEELQQLEERLAQIDYPPAEPAVPLPSQWERLGEGTPQEGTPQEGAGDEDDPDEGPGQDFQVLLAGARQLEPAPASQASEDDDFPLLPADGDVKLRARNGPKPGAEFVGKSTLAGASGLYCLIERFNLPVGTRMKLTLTAPRFTDRFDIDDAVVKRVRRAPANTTEVQLSFEQRHDDFEEFVAHHFGDKPVGFALFTRRRPKR